MLKGVGGKLANAVKELSTNTAVSYDRQGRRKKVGARAAHGGGRCGARGASAPAHGWQSVHTAGTLHVMGTSDPHHHYYHAHTYPPAHPPHPPTHTPALPHHG